MHLHVFTSMFPQTEFEKCGRVVDVYNTGKGFAFVTFDRKEDAATAISELDGANVCGQSIKVSIAKSSHWNTFIAVFSKAEVVTLASSGE